jgi:AcrR family transcriptional regulator
MSAKPQPTRISGRLQQNGILAAAASVFKKKGAVATRVEDLLRAADVARRTFYKYFESKEDVLAALYEVATQEIVAAVLRAGDPSNPLVALHRGIDFYLDYHVSNATLIKILEEHAIRSDSPLAPLRRRFRTQMVEVMITVAESVANERVDPMTCVALLVALEGTSLYLVEGKEPPSASEIARAKKVMHRMLDRVLGK